MLGYAGTFALAMVLLLLVDFLYLSVISGPALRMFQAIQGSPVTFNYVAAAIVYVALAYLITLPGIDSAPKAAALGAATYAVYDFTQLVTFDKYPLWFAMADSLWGGVLMAVVWWIALQFKLVTPNV